MGERSANGIGAGRCAKRRARAARARARLGLACAIALVLMPSAGGSAQDKRVVMRIGQVYAMPLDGADAFSDSGPGIVHTQVTPDGRTLRVRCVAPGTQTIALFQGRRPMRRLVVVCRAP
ncbi:MAG TPA: hypothetical protein VIL20_26840 [Sandaracinaceae bacterium]